jgi:hypothetical protein
VHCSCPGPISFVPCIYFHRLTLTKLLDTGAICVPDRGPELDLLRAWWRRARALAQVCCTPRPEETHSFCQNLPVLLQCALADDSHNGVDAHLLGICWRVGSWALLARATSWGAIAKKWGYLCVAIVFETHLLPHAVQGAPRDQWLLRIPACGGRCRDTTKLSVTAVPLRSARERRRRDLP